MAVAVSGFEWSVVFDGDEKSILAELDDAIVALEPGVIATWNGARFDLPFIGDRARSAGLSIGLSLTPDTISRSRHEPLAGHSTGYFGSWYQHAHLDAYRVYRADVGASLGIPCGLKPLARLMGLAPVEVDASAIHELDTAEVRAYVASDAILTRELALRRWPTARRAIDQLP